MDALHKIDYLDDLDHLGGEVDNSVGVIAEAVSAMVGANSDNLDRIASAIDAADAITATRDAEIDDLNELHWALNASRIDTSTLSRCAKAAQAELGRLVDVLDTLGEAHAEIAAG